MKAAVRNKMNFLQIIINFIMSATVIFGGLVLLPKAIYWCVKEYKK